LYSRRDWQAPTLEGSGKLPREHGGAFLGVDGLKHSSIGQIHHSVSEVVLFLWLLILALCSFLVEKASVNSYVIFSYSIPVTTFDMPLYKAHYSGISSPFFQPFLPRSGTGASRRQPVFWIAVFVLWRFSIFIAFVASTVADICLLVGTDKAPNALCCA
jgi:hypothetical protein